jgi:hypothetical protein
MEHNRQPSTALRTASESADLADQLDAGKNPGGQLEQPASDGRL